MIGQKAVQGMTATAAQGFDAEMVKDVGLVGGALQQSLANIAICDGMAKANIHGKPPLRWWLASFLDIVADNANDLQLQAGVRIVGTAAGKQLAAAIPMMARLLTTSLKERAK